jgi:hypothetical protein
MFAPLAVCQWRKFAPVHFFTLAKFGCYTDGVDNDLLIKETIMRYLALLAALSFPALPLIPAIVFAQTATAPVPSAPPGGHWHHGDMIKKWQAKFDAANTTHDGHLTLAQAKAANLIPVETNFTAIDTKNRGYVTFNDILAWRMDQRAQKLEQNAATLRAED